MRYLENEFIETRQRLLEIFLEKVLTEENPCIFAVDREKYIKDFLRSIYGFRT